MSKKIIISFLLLFAGIISANANCDTVASDFFNAIFNCSNGGEEMRNSTTIQNILKAGGYKVSAPVASHVDVWLDNDKHFKVKSTRITYSDGGNKLILNIPTAAKYKKHFEVSLSFADKYMRNLFYQAASENGFEYDDGAVDGIQYMGSYYILSSDSDNDLKVSISDY